MLSWTDGHTQPFSAANVLPCPAITAELTGDNMHVTTTGNNNNNSVIYLNGGVEIGFLKERTQTSIVWQLLFLVEIIKLGFKSTLVSLDFPYSQTK